MGGCGNKWLTGKGEEEESKAEEEEASESISVEMLDSTYIILEFPPGNQGGSDTAASDHTVRP